MTTRAGDAAGDVTAMTLVFADRRTEGAYPVTDAAGETVAAIRSSRGGARFAAEDATGGPLCAGQAGWWGMSNRWRATGPSGDPLLEMRKDMLRARGDVHLQRGGGLVVEGSIWRRSFEVRDAGRVVLGAVPRTSALSLRPYEYAVQQLAEGLTLSEVVAVVQIWRMLRKRDDASAAAGSTAVIASS